MEQYNGSSCCNDVCHTNGRNYQERNNDIGRRLPSHDRAIRPAKAVEGNIRSIQVKRKSKPSLFNDYILQGQRPRKRFLVKRYTLPWRSLLSNEAAASYGNKRPHQVFYSAPVQRPLTGCTRLSVRMYIHSRITVRLNVH